ncbi:MAG: hypothetical protein K8S27_06845 [Candidatus Omnitrophica bacterium]|nr:hypothetical protein [Candidatus Omnitrophota bacterium]
MNKIYPVAELSGLLEDDLQILNFRFAYKGRLMWPYIRGILMQSAVIEMFQWDFPIGQKKKIIPKDIIPYGLNVLTKNPFRPIRSTTSDIIFFSSSIVNVLSEDGVYVNRLYDHFALDFQESSLIIEDSLSKQFRFMTPRQCPHVRYNDWILIHSLLKSKVFKKNTSDLTTIDHLLNFLKKRLPLALNDALWANMSSVLNLISGLLPYLDEYYQRLFRILEPKIVFLEDASYGHKCHILNAAHEMGLMTGEFQHGAFHKNHFAYIYNNLLNSEYVNYLPRYLMSYGEYWRHFPKTSSEIVTIGNPYIIEYTKNIMIKPKAKEQILFISGGSKTTLLNESLVYLINELGSDQYEFVIRPHPAEYNFITERYSSMISRGDVKISIDNLFASLSKADKIVSFESSTVLFEALVFDNQIFLHNRADVSYFIDPDIFSPFQSKEELLSMILSPPTRKYSSGSMWDPFWKENFRRFIFDQFGLKNTTIV